jgi:hypothetical protein
MNQLPRVERSYTIAFQECFFHLTKEQTILLSTSAFQYNKEYSKPFEIGNPPAYISDEEVKISINSLLGIFLATDHFEITSDSISAFLFLAHQIDNLFLEKFCLKMNLYSN